MQLDRIRNREDRLCDCHVFRKSTQIASIALGIKTSHLKHELLFLSRDRDGENTQHNIIHGAIESFGKQFFFFLGGGWGGC